ncbi:MAG: ADOP family duplicated permease [Gemmatimonadaceae bacterium]
MTVRFTRLFRRLRYWLRFPSHSDELIDELAFHREMIERDLIRGGMSPATAREHARRTLGNETTMREEARSVWLSPFLEGLWQDATYTLRNLRRQPAFTLGVILTLALGIGANAAMFGLVDRLLFRAPPMMIDPATVHRVYLYRRNTQGDERPTGGVYARYRDLERWSTSFSQTAGAGLRSVAVGEGDDTRVRGVAVVSAEFFGFFDAPPILGRYFTASEDVPPSPAQVVVLSSSFWRTQFGSRTDVIGSIVRIDAAAYRIIGVAPDGFIGLWPYQPPVAFIPVATFAANRGYPDWATTYGTAFNLGMIVRRKPDVSVAVANADLTNALRQSYQASNAGNPDARSLADLRPRALVASILAERGPERSSVARAATWLSGVTLIVLLIACANVANLLLARTIRRRREIAVRIALGVSRVRLLRLLLTEGIVLAALGGVAALLIAVWGSNVLRAAFLPDAEPAALITDPRTVLFAGGVALAVGVLVGLVPMAQVVRGGLTADLKSGAREGTYQRTTLRSALLLIQCALSLVLLVGAGLFVQSLRNVRDVRLGFEPEPVLVVELNMRDVRLDSARLVALRLRLLESVKSLPGVSHATFQLSIPFAGGSNWPLFVSGIDSVDKLGLFNYNTASPDFFRTMGTRIVRGRGIESTDVDRAPRVAVVGESMAAVLWPGADPIGQCFRLGADTMPCTYVVGVAEDIHSRSFEAEAKLYFYYMPAAQWRPHYGGLFVRAQGDPGRLIEPVRRHLQREMPGASFITVQPLADIVDTQRRSWIAGAKVFTAFGVLALVLAAVGLYSVIAYSVAQRKHELGVRLALGAGRVGIVRLVMTQGLRFALAGVAIGGAAALVIGPRIGPLLFHQSPRDPSVLALAAVVLLGVAGVASCVPAFRAAGVDPRTALQAD